ncbi:glycosyltransferase [Agreia sp. Leaf244]|uniref:glycosyltransferase n=1 Tax=Agreia sp. Leaf244 TaxID=1736305 RepID=UPI000AC0347F|nr:glycosyltransferase [Agreia sp. Leaf244]
MSQPRILVVHPSAELYGSDRVLLESVAGFVERGAEVTVLVGASGPLEGQLRDCGALVQVCPMPVVRKAVLRPKALARFLGESLAAFARGVGLVRRLGPSVVYVSTLTIPVWNAIAYASRVPLVVHVHEAERSAGRLIRTALNAPLRLARLVVLNSVYSQRTVELSYPGVGAKSEIVYNGVVGPQTIEPARAFLDGELRMVYVGRLSSRKGPDVIVEAMARASHRAEISLTIVGAVYPGYEWFEDQLKLRVRELGLTARVRFEGFQPSGYPYLEDGDIAIVPSTVDEPFGNTAVEAMLAARPAIVSDTSGLREAGAGYESVLFVEPGNPDKLAAAIDRMVAEWSSFRVSARDDAHRAHERHGIETYRAALWASMAAAVPSISGATQRTATEASITA